MVKRNLDQLFQEKLGDMTISPSDAARQVLKERIIYRSRVGLVKKIGIAASIIFVIGAGFLGFNQLKEQSPRIALEESVQAVENELELFEGVDNKSISIPLAQMDKKIESSGMVEEDSEPIVKSDQVIDIENPVTVEPSGMLVEADPEEEIEKIGNAIVAEGHIEGQVEGRLIEYSIIEPESSQEEQLATVEPIKITIEYKFSGSRSKKESKIKQLYIKINKMKPADEVFGDLRTLKDKVFALNFKKENKVENQKKSE